MYTKILRGIVAEGHLGSIQNVNKIGIEDLLKTNSSIAKIISYVITCRGELS